MNAQGSKSAIEDREAENWDQSMNIISHIEETS